MEKDKRIKNEIERHSTYYADLPADKKALSETLIKRASFMRIELEDLEDYLKINGWSELFQQSEKVPAYMRARPEGNTYITLNANYQKIMKQLEQLLPVNADVDSNEMIGFLGSK